MVTAEQAARYFSYVFHPLLFLFEVSVLTAYYEWKRRGEDRRELWRRWGAFSAISAVALLPVAAYVVVATKGLSLALSNSWPIDVLTGTSLTIAGTLTFLAWRRFDWGELMPRAAVALIAVMIPHVLISPLWNISGHVAFSLMPALYLTLVDRKFWPLLTVPVLTVVARSISRGHTWPQSIAGFVSATVMTLLAFYLYDDVRRLLPTRQRAPAE